VVLADRVPVAEDLDPDQQYIVDGSLLPCWSWADHPELYSGKHKTTGLNVQVACDLSGQLARVSDPVNGKTHDITALRASGVLDTDFAGRWIADKGYLGSDTIHPIRKPIFRNLLDWEKQLNTDINRIRYKIEQAIANLKTWRALHPTTDDHSKHSKPPSPQSSDSNSSGRSVNDPPALPPQPPLPHQLQAAWHIADVGCPRGCAARSAGADRLPGPGVLSSPGRRAR